MGAVHQRVHAASLQFPDDLPRGKDEGGGAGHMIQHQQACAWRDGAEHGFDDLLAGAQRKRHGHHDQPGARLTRGLGEHIAAGIVIVVRGQEFIAPLQLQGTDDGIHAGRGVRDKHQVARPRPNEPRQFTSRRFQPLFVTSPEKLDRLGFHLPAEFRLQLEDRVRARPEAAVVQEHRARLE